MHITLTNNVTILATENGNKPFYFKHSNSQDLYEGLTEIKGFDNINIISIKCCTSKYYFLDDQGTIYIVPFTHFSKAIDLEKLELPYFIIDFELVFGLRDEIEFLSLLDDQNRVIFYKMKTKNSKILINNPDYSCVSLFRSDFRGITFALSEDKTLIYLIRCNNDQFDIEKINSDKEIIRVYSSYNTKCDIVIYYLTTDNELYQVYYNFGGMSKQTLKWDNIVKISNHGHLMVCDIGSLRVTTCTNNSIKTMSLVMQLFNNFDELSNKLSFKNNLSQFYMYAYREIYVTTIDNKIYRINSIDVKELPRADGKEVVIVNPYCKKIIKSVLS